MSKNTYVYIWGAGRCGVLTALDCEKNGINVIGFIDAKASQIKTRIGLPVLDPCSPILVPKSGKDTYVIIAVQNEKIIKEITTNLRSQEIRFEISQGILNLSTQCHYNYYTNPQQNSKVPPPTSIIPEHLKNDFTMNGQIPVLYWYFDERSYSIIYNSIEDYKNAFENMKNGTFKYYGKDINSFLYAFERYSLKGKSILVWGLAGLNCEAMALWQGAEHVYVVDYNKPVCEHDKITVMTHEELAKSGIKTDVAISFSSFEHDGLGRYGDPLNPNGDLKAMQVAREYLRDDGFLFLGVPQGKDCLVWNAHRIYGEKRLPLLLKGWKVEAVFEQESPGRQPLGAYHVQPLMILNKKR